MTVMTGVAEDTIVKYTVSAGTIVRYTGGNSRYYTRGREYTVVSLYEIEGRRYCLLTDDMRSAGHPWSLDEFYKEKFVYVSDGSSQQRPADMVNRPPHYTAHPSGVECIQITEHMNFCRGNAVKYLWRAGSKGNELEDLKKARWCIDREIRRLEKTGVDT